MAANVTLVELEMCGGFHPTVISLFALVYTIPELLLRAAVRCANGRRTFLEALAQLPPVARGIRRFTRTE